MIELVLPDALEGNGTLNDDRLSLMREMVGRRVFAFDGLLEEVLTLAENLSEESRGSPVLVNDVTSKTENTRRRSVHAPERARAPKRATGERVGGRAASAKLTLPIRQLGDVLAEIVK